MAKVGPQRAAELTGRSKSTVQRAMKAGKLSYEVDSAGRRVIDVSELDRVFGLVPQGATATPAAASAAVESELEKATMMLETERLKMRIKMLEEQIEQTREMTEDLKAQRDQWQKQAQQVLLTSQYSQQQAEELKAEIRERDRREKVRRQMELERRGKQASGARPQNENRKAGPLEQKRKSVMAAKPFDIQGMWKKIRGSNESIPAETTPAERASA